MTSTSSEPSRLDGWNDLIVLVSAGREQWAAARDTIREARGTVILEEAMRPERRTETWYVPSRRGRFFTFEGYYRYNQAVHIIND